MKKPAIYAAAVGALAAAFITGRYTVPTKVVEKEKVVEHIDETKVAELSETINTLRGRITELESETHIEEETVEKPDGTKTTKKTTDTKSKSTEKVVETVYVDREVKVVETKVVDREVTKEKRVETRRPDWRISAFAGVNVADPGFKPTPPYVSPVLGLGVERRMIGPVHVGIFGMTNKTVGLSASFEFDL